jgi:hypothetical protein
MTLVSRIRCWLSPACAVPRLRVCYYTALAILAVVLLAAHRLAVREHRDARLLAVAAHACQTQTALPVVFVRVPPSRAAVKANSNIRRAAHAAAVREK